MTEVLLAALVIVLPLLLAWWMVARKGPVDKGVNDNAPRAKPTHSGKP